MSEKKKVNRITDYRSKVNWIANLYEENEGGLVHGFQKEAIQNSTGARASSTYKEWKCEIKIEKTEKGLFLIVEDYGTVGLTGNNYSSSELKEMVKNRELVDKPEERLARLSCDNVSGNDKLSAGLFGVGKTMYIATSNSYTYFFESITEQEGRRCNINEEDEMFDKAIEGEEAKLFIEEQTGLKAIDHIGTRFIIVDPKEDVVEAILGENKTLLKYVQETWWRIIRKLPEESGIYVQGVKAKVPEEYDFDERININQKDSFFSFSSYAVEAGYKVKKIGFFINNDLPDYLSGFYFYRRGMKISTFNLKEVEGHIPCNYFGFIEVDSDWENELSRIENPTHYGIISKYKNLNVYQYLQRAVKDQIDECLVNWGYIKDEQNENKAIRELADSIKEEIIETLTESGFEKISEGDHKSPFDVRLSNVCYPHINENGFERTAFSNEKIGFEFQVFNRTGRNDQYMAKVCTKGPDGDVLSTIYEKELSVIPDGSVKDKIEITVNGDNSTANSRNMIYLCVYNSNGRGKTIERKLYYYYGIETEVKPVDDFKLTINSFEFPRRGDRRVNTNELLQNVTYRIENNLTKPVKVFLPIYSLNASNNNEKLDEISKDEYIIPPFGEEFITTRKDIYFAWDVYLPKLKKGIIEIRASLILGENLVEKRLPKAYKLDDYGFKVYFNKPEKAGLDFPYELKNSDKHLRSWIESKNTISINLSHPEYLKCASLEEKGRYIAYQYLRQVVLIYARNGSLDKELIGSDGSINNLDYAKNLEDKIEEIWYRQCQK